MSTSVDEPPKPEPAVASRFRQLRAKEPLAIPCPGVGPGAAMEFPARGSKVRKGEALLRAVPPGAVQVHSPVDGQIIGEGSAVLCGAGKMTCVHVEPDLDATDDAPTEVEADESDITGRFTSLPGIADRLVEAGVWADRWASPDLRGQLRGPHLRPIDTIFCNALDESMEVPLQATIAAQHARTIVKVLLALASASGAGRVQIVLGFYTPAVLIDSVRAAVAGTPIRLTAIRNDYPQPNPVLLIHQLTGRRMRWGELPTEHGVLVLDAAAAVLTGQALLEERPMLSAFLAIHDYSRDATHLVCAPVGMRVGEVLRELDMQSAYVELRAGSPLRQIRLNGDCVIGGGELCLSASLPESKLNPDPCIRCAWCVEGCPVQIRPATLLDASQHEDTYTAIEAGIDACIECGICSYVCPSNLPLLKGIRALRSLPRGKDR